MGRKREYNTDLDKTILDMYINKSMSLREISRQIGFHYEIIRRRLYELGAEVRTRSDSMYNYWQHKKL